MEVDPRAARFWALVDKTGDCWMWQGAQVSDGYGRIMINRVFYLAHRLSWELANGRPPVLQVLHTCDTPGCVRPKHLYEGTQSKNILDAVARGRHPRNRGGAKLTWEDVAVIRASTEQHVALARQYGVGRHAIQDIRAGRTWLCRTGTSVTSPQPASCSCSKD